MANVDKSSVYFGDIKPEIQQDIPQTLEFTKGEMPFRYLGIPLSIKRLSTIQCKSLLDKMLAKIKSYTTRYLSYVGILHLVKSVLFSI